MSNERSHPRPQFGLATLFLMVTAAGMLFAALYWYGPRGVIGGIRVACVGLVILVAWAWAYSRVPELMKIATLGIVLGGVLLGGLAAGLNESREAARRHQCSDNMREIGMEHLQDATFHPK